MISANAITSQKSIAIIIAGIVLLWILSGIIIPSKTDFKETFDRNAAPVTIRTELSEAQSQIIEYRFHGVTESNRFVNLRAEVNGSVTAINAEEGSKVETGDVIVSLDVKERNKSLEQAQALVNQREIEFKSARSLSQKGLNSEAQFMQAKSRLREAEALLVLSQTNLTKTQITAPFSGILNRIHVELGDLAENNNPTNIATILDLDPIIITSDVSEAMIQKIKPGKHAKAYIRGFGMHDATITYVSKTADPVTRTFPIEIAVSNPDYAIPEGITSTLIIPEEITDIHIIPSSILTLDDNGDIGIRTVSETNKVTFYPIEIINDSGNGLWVAGLPPKAHIITLGQSYVNENTDIRLEATKP